MLSRHLSEGVVTEILSTLPVKSLMQFKSVNKAWYAFIKNPHFITKHHTFAIFYHNRNHCHRVILGRCRAIDTPCFSMHSNDTLEFSGHIHLVPQLFSEDINLVIFVGTCNGIVCVVGISADRYHGGPDPDQAWEIGFLNPATRESKRISFVPRLPVVVPLPPDFSLPSFNFGFGIDLHTNDFQVVKITCFDYLRHYQVEIYCIGFGLRTQRQVWNCLMSKVRHYSKATLQKIQIKNFQLVVKLRMLSRHLPEDVVTEILSTLPVKSLMRFKSVSKAWYALIRNPHFITKHHTFAISDHSCNHCRRVILERYRAIDTPRFSMHSNDTLEFSGDVHLIPQLFSEDIKPVLFIGSCNGIVCVVGISVERLHGGPDPDRAWEIGLWNPATRESKRLPFAPRPPDFVPFPPDFRLPSYDFGFGVDLNTNDFKVVKITCFYSPRHYQVEVYNLTTDSWRVTDASLNSAYFINRSNFPSYLNGFCYWLVFPQRCDREHNLLLSFDMSNEMFREIMLPDDIRSLVDTIAIINDSVAVIFPTYSNSSRNDVGLLMEYEIWVMNESIVECSWTKLFTIAVPSRPLQFREDGLIVLNSDHCVSDKKCLVLFDPRTGELKNLPIYDEGAEMFQLVSYRESLVLVNGWRNVLEQQDT